MLEAMTYNGNEVSSGERTGKVQDTDEIREDVREDVGSRGGSKPALRPVGGTVSNEAQATESIIDNGDALVLLILSRSLHSGQEK